MPRIPPEQRDHRDWLALAQPTGLVVAPAALVRRNAILDRRDGKSQVRLREWLEEFDPVRIAHDPTAAFRAFAKSILGWGFSSRWYAVRGRDNDERMRLPSVRLPEYDETLTADFAARAPDSSPAGPPPGELAPDSSPAISQGHAAVAPDSTSSSVRRPAIRNQPDDTRSGDKPCPWQLAVTAYGPDQHLDKPFRGTGRLRESPNARMERLLRETGIPAGLIWGQGRLRLISAPRGESSGSVDFVLAHMKETAGRPLIAALRLLLGEPRLLAAPSNETLPALLAESREYQNVVSERLAAQVLGGLYELLRGVDAADADSRGVLLRDYGDGQLHGIYRGLLTVILRLVFVLYAEQRGLLPDDETFTRHYSLGALFERLRDDEARHPDTMAQRYGAWAQLLTLFRMIHDGAEADGMRLPKRPGVLFDPDAHPFLEGRMRVGGRQAHERIEPPRIADGVVLAVLRNLLVLDGERISYRALDVEQIGSVYETMMGFRPERTTGPSLAIRSSKPHGGSTVLDLDGLLRIAPGARSGWIQKRTDRKITPLVTKAVRAACDPEALHAALDRVVDRAATSDVAPAGSLVLQPTDERRRSGSHYTPRSLTEPIVRRTLEPVLDRLRREARGRSPTPAAILDLKVCDPAMGSGAFLVEACRQLGEALLEGWRAHGGRPELPSDEDETIFARRLVAQRCLYGVDRNPVAVDLAKLSLWLATLAKDHPLTFVDHALRAGDSLVGLTRKQIERVNWLEGGSPDLHAAPVVEKAIKEVGELRRQIREAGDEVPDAVRRSLWQDAENALSTVRLFGDLVVAVFFDRPKPKARRARRRALAKDITEGRAGEHRSWIEELRSADPPLAPFHWELEFPEVFERDNPGFDAFVGNPPFAGKNTTRAANPQHYPTWLKHQHRESHGNSDLVAHFFRRGFGLLRWGGTLGLIATNTIAQGDTRSTGLRWICLNRGTIYDATRRYRWPGQAAVVVSVVHLCRGVVRTAKRLDGKLVARITAFLFDQGGDEDPKRPEANAGKSFQGSIVLGMGFTFDDTDKKGIASPIADMDRLIAKDPRNREVIFPYLGGKELNQSPTHAHHRYVINFRDWPLRREDLGDKWSEADKKQRRAWLRTGIVPLDYPDRVAADYPDLLSIVERTVKPARAHLTTNAIGRKRAQFWWRYGSLAKELYAAIAGLDRVLAISRVGQQAAVTLVRADQVFADSCIVFPFETHAAFASLQSRPHEVWARFFGSSMKDDLRYTPSDCFETFPFPTGWTARQDLEVVGKAYYDHRAALMVARDEGLTKTYNRLHNPHEYDSDIEKLRELHAAMDRAVLDAYGWDDIPTDCDFFPLHPDDEQDEDDTRRRKTRKFRYRWPDEVQNEILARLLDLNAQRAAEEAAAAKRT